MTVATKGAEDTAGSAPNRRRNIGNIEPISVPHKTTPSKDKPTVHPIGMVLAP